jgi:hypothetical protein
MLTKNTISTVSRLNTLKPLGIYFKPFAQIVYMPLNTINGVENPKHFRYHPSYS